MAKLTQELLEQYFDGELTARKARQVELLLESSPEHRDALTELSHLGDLLRLMNTETLSDVSFDGFSAQVDREIRAGNTRPSLLKRTGVWLSEFFENRRVVWVPAAATIGAVALALVILPFGPSSPNLKGPQTAEPGIQLHRGYTPLTSKINTVDFGDLSGTQYAIEDDLGGTVGVVWINENP